MNITVFATRSCPHRVHLEGWLCRRGIGYSLSYVEDEPTEADRIGVHRSPCLVVDGEIVFAGLPSHAEFEAWARKWEVGDPGSPGVD